MESVGVFHLSKGHWVNIIGIALGKISIKIGQNKLEADAMRWLTKVNSPNTDWVDICKSSDNKHSMELIYQRWK